MLIIAKFIIINAGVIFKDIFRDPGHIRSLVKERRDISFAPLLERSRGLKPALDSLSIHFCSGKWQVDTILNERIRLYFPYTPNVRNRLLEIIDIFIRCGEHVRSIKLNTEVIAKLGTLLGITAFRCLDHIRIQFYAS